MTERILRRAAADLARRDGCQVVVCAGICRPRPCTATPCWTPCSTPKSTSNTRTTSLSAPLRCAAASISWRACLRRSARGGDCFNRQPRSIHRLCARLFGVRARSVPEGANLVKVEAMRSYGAEVVLHGADFEASKRYCAELEEEEVALHLVRR